MAYLKLCVCVRAYACVVRSKTDSTELSSSDISFINILPTLKSLGIIFMDHNRFQQASKLIEFLIPLCYYDNKLILE